MGSVIAQLGQQNVIESAGTLNLPNDAIQLRVNGQFNDLESLRQMPIRGMSGQQIRLGDLGVIKRDYIDPPQVKVRHNGEQVIGVGVSMAKGGDIIALGQSLQPDGGQHRGHFARRHGAGAGAGPAQRGVQLGQRIRQGADRGGGDRAGGELSGAGPAQAPRQQPLVAAGHWTSAPAWWWASRFRWCWR